MRKRVWKSVLSLNLALLVLGAHAELPKYRLKQIENKDYRRHGYYRALKMLHLQSEDLGQYQCDGVQEYALLPPLVRANPSGNSLSIEGYKIKESVVYRDGELYSANGKDPARAEIRADLFIKYTLDALGKIEALPSGKILLDRLEHSPYPLTIRYGTPHFWAEDRSGKRLGGMLMAQSIQLLNTLRWPNYGDEFDRVGAGGEINFDPKLKSEFTEDDGVKRRAPPHVVLGHEMGHAFDGIRGLLDRREVVGKAYEFIEVAEYRATYFENRIREESGLHYRKFYGDGTDGRGSLLGSDGKPMLLPTPCLVWSDDESAD
jgi:hypothetical protein